jgi:murein DD-endopeptidase MepM/ murein hydrolase activator NlpD
MRGILYKTGPLPVRRLARSRVTRWLVAIFVGATSVGGYVHFVPQLTSSFPFACNIPAQAVLEEKAFEAESDQNQQLAMPDPASLAASEDIADQSAPGDSLLSLLSYNGAKDESAREMAKRLAAVIAFSEEKSFTKNTRITEGTRYSLSVDGEGRVLKATIEIAPDKVFHAVAGEAGVRAWKEDVVLDFRVESAVFRVRNSLIQSIVNAGEGTELAREVYKVFRWDIDFQTESLDGDTCKVLFERRYADDRPSGYGRVLCAMYEGKKIDSDGKKISKMAVLFSDHYYDASGVSLKKDLLRSPLSVMRKTSGYGMRQHPIFNCKRMHHGVDYGAPAGTPVWSIARGVITFAGFKDRGYGNFVCIRHDNGLESRYGHLQKINVRQGQKVKQGQNIGLVGATGDATGPHLHFEFLANGQRKDPGSVTSKMVKTVTAVPPGLKTRFAEVAQERLQDLESLVIINKTTGMGKAASLR